MKRFFVFIALIFAIICGVQRTDAVECSCLIDDCTQIEAIDSSIQVSINQPTDKFFISNNIQNTCEYIFGSFGSIENNFFDVQNLFVNYRQNLKIHTQKDEYLLSISSNPRAP